MTLEELKIKLDNANEAVEKRIKIASRYCEDWMIEKRPETWSDIKEITENSEARDNLAKLMELRRVRDNWQNKYNIEYNKQQAPKIQILVDFLEEWGKMARSWYLHNADYMVEKMNEFHKLAYEFALDSGFDKMDWKDKKAFRVEFNKHFNNINRYSFSYVDEQDWLRKYNIENLTKELSHVRFTGHYSQELGYSSEEGQFYLDSYDTVKLDKLLENEKKRKYEDLVNRITKYTGEIIDISNLHIAGNGDLNGVVVGKDGKAKVETISAGGYNIQCFHYRVLIKKLSN